MLSPIGSPSVRHRWRTVPWPWRLHRCGGAPGIRLPMAFEVSGRIAWTASGFGGQFLVVIPSLDLVVVVTHDTFHDAVMPVQPHYSPHAFLESFVVPSIGDVPSEAAGCGG